MWWWLHQASLWLCQSEEIWWWYSIQVCQFVISYIIHWFLHWDFGHALSFVWNRFLEFFLVWLQTYSVHYWPRTNHSTYHNLIIVDVIDYWNNIFVYQDFTFLLVNCFLKFNYLNQVLGCLMSFCNFLLLFWDIHRDTDCSHFIVQFDVWTRYMWHADKKTPCYTFLPGAKLSPQKGSTMWDWQVNSFLHVYSSAWCKL